VMEPSAPIASSAAGGQGDRIDLSATRKKSRRHTDPNNQKRRCVSTACVACRRRKSKCDGALPSCAACASVYGTDCIYDPNSDHRRKGVYKERVDSSKAQESTLHILIEAILNSSEDEVYDIVGRIRTCEDLDAMAESLVKSSHSAGDAASEDDDNTGNEYATTIPVDGERDLARKMGELRLENGSVRFIGGTSNLIYVGAEVLHTADVDTDESVIVDANPVTSWTSVTKDPQVIVHLLNMYWNWHYPYFTTLSRSLFYRDFLVGKSRVPAHQTAYCSSLLVNAMLSLGCHFTNIGAAYAVPGDSWTKGDHFFTEAKRLIMVNDEYEKPRLTTVQALALMSVREAGCGREARGWVYSGMSFRMAQDLGLNMDIAGVNAQNQHLDEKEVDARRVTFWGCFLFDKCWSNYLGRLPQLPKNSFNVPKYDVFPEEDAQDWSPYTDTGYDEVNRQPSRTRAVGLQLLKLSEISSDLLLFFYHPNHIKRSYSKSVELKKLSELHRRLEEWRKDVPKELEPKDGQLPNVILMHMFFHLQYIHLFRPFLRYAPNASPLPSHVSPRRMCTANAGAISKLMRLYKKTYNLRQICNIAVYMLHSACTIHLLNLPEKTAKRDIIHGVKHLEEIAEDWLCGRRTLSIISVLARKWKCELPEEASQVLQRTDERWGFFNTSDVPSPRSLRGPSPSPSYQAPSPHFKQEYHSPGRIQVADSKLASSTLPLPQDTSVPNFTPDSGQATNPGSADVDILGVTQSSSATMAHSVQLSTRNYSGPNWQPSSVGQAPATKFSGGFFPSLQEVVSDQGSNGTTRNQTPNSTFAVDGDEWYLKDGANWQSGFDAWNTSALNSSPATMTGMNTEQSSMFMFNASEGRLSDTTRGLGSVQPGAARDFGFESLASLPENLESWDFGGLE